jgi:hypothetical protein
MNYLNGEFRIVAEIFWENFGKECAVWRTLEDEFEKF